ncbi:MAG: hypothetical protein MZW92_75940, partial [Comamonadaceae bacterium]|nr:hypothetical protein [Comamonadaceae bacterium]
MALSKVPGVKAGPARAARHRTRRPAVALLRRQQAPRWRRTSTIDITPPTLELVADDRYVNFGGVGVIVYKASAGHGRERREDRRLLLPGLPGPGEGPPGPLARPLRASVRRRAGGAGPCSSPPTEAGNTRETASRLRAEGRQVQEEHVIALSDGFLQNKIAPLLADASAAAGRAEGRLRRRQQAAAQGERGPHRRGDHPSHADDAEVLKKGRCLCVNLSNTQPNEV